MNTLIADIIKEFPEELERQLTTNLKWLVPSCREDVIRWATIAMNKAIMSALIEDLKLKNDQCVNTMKSIEKGDVQ
jgi:hypothetical protein